MSDTDNSPGDNDFGYRPRRSVLYMPAANQRALEKAKTLPADSIIFDLEDAVAPEAKVEARANADEAVRSGEYGRRELTIRCNGLDTPWGEADLTTAAQAGPSAVVIPKVNSTSELDDIAGILDEAAGESSVSIWAMIETPTAILDVRAIASHPRVTVLVMGTNDLAKELHTPLLPGRVALAPHLAQAVLAAREAGKVIIDGVFNNLTDEAGFTAEAIQGFEWGFDGKTLIHPSQIEPTNEIWAPSLDDIDSAQKIIDAFTEAETEGRGVVTVDGRMIENLHVETARRTLAVADAIIQSGN